MAMSEEQRGKTTEQEALRTVVMDCRLFVAEKKETEFCDKRG